MNKHEIVVHLPIPNRFQCPSRRSFMDEQPNTENHWSMDEQRRVETFLETHELHGEPAYRILDLAAEIGELAADAAKSSEYGASPEQITVKSDEIGDALFSLLATAESLDIDAGETLDEALGKYQSRLETTGTAQDGPAR